MTIKEFADSRWLNTPQEVLESAGIRVIHSYRSQNNAASPEKISQKEGTEILQVYNYPDEFTKTIEKIFNRLIKEGRFQPQQKEKRKRKRIVKPHFSTNGSV